MSPRKTQVMTDFGEDTGQSGSDKGEFALWPQMLINFINGSI